jgi:hypothetical protein
MKPELKLELTQAELIFCMLLLSEPEGCDVSVLARSLVWRGYLTLTLCRNRVILSEAGRAVVLARLSEGECHLGAAMLPTVRDICGSIHPTEINWICHLPRGHSGPHIRT